MFDVFDGFVRQRDLADNWGVAATVLHDRYASLTRGILRMGCRFKYKFKYGLNTLTACSIS